MLFERRVLQYMVVKRRRMRYERVSEVDRVQINFYFFNASSRSTVQHEIHGVHEVF